MDKKKAVIVEFRQILALIKLDYHYHRLKFIELLATGMLFPFLAKSLKMDIESSYSYYYLNTWRALSLFCVFMVPMWFFAPFDDKGVLRQFKALPVGHGQFFLGKIIGCWLAQIGFYLGPMVFFWLFVNLLETGDSLSFDYILTSRIWVVLFLAPIMVALRVNAGTMSFVLLLFVFVLIIPFMVMVFFPETTVKVLALSFLLSLDRVPMLFILILALISILCSVLGFQLFTKKTLYRKLL